MFVTGYITNEVLTWVNRSPRRPPPATLGPPEPSETFSTLSVVYSHGMRLTGIMTEQLLLRTSVWSLRALTWANWANRTLYFPQPSQPPQHDEEQEALALLFEEQEAWEWATP